MHPQAGPEVRQRPRPHLLGRQVLLRPPASKIADENGPSSLLSNLDSVEAPDDTTVVFNLKAENDQIFPQILSSPVGPIVDEEVFSADELTPDDDDRRGQRRSPASTSITSYDDEQPDLVQGQPRLPGPARRGRRPARSTSSTTPRPSNLKLDIEEGDIDVAFRSLSADRHRGPARQRRRQGRRRSRRRDPLHRLQLQHPAVRRQDRPRPTRPRRSPSARRWPTSIDREALADQVYKGTYTPLYSYVPTA